MACKSVQGMRRGREGVLDAAMLLAGGELAAALLPLRHGPIAALVKRMIDTTPGPAVDFGVATAQTLDKLLLRTTAVAGCMAAGAALPAGAKPRGNAGRRAAAAAIASAAAI